MRQRSAVERVLTLTVARERDAIALVAMPCADRMLT
jgi:hypothetical protein